MTTRTWFTSDTHFGHKRILELCARPFDDIEQMNDALVSKWNEVVAPEDTVYHLGDVALGPINESLEHIRQLNGTIILVQGNHDRFFTAGKRSGGLEPWEWMDVYRDAGFNFVCSGAGVVLDGVNFNLSHFPYTGDSHGEDRYAKVRLQDDGVPLIHGHTHSKEWPVSTTESGTVQIHVGVDAWDYAPVEAESVLACYWNSLK